METIFEHYGAYIINVLIAIVLCTAFYNVLGDNKIILSLCLKNMMG